MTMMVILLNGYNDLSVKYICEFQREQVKQNWSHILKVNMLLQLLYRNFSLPIMNNTRYVI